MAIKIDPKSAYSAGAREERAVQRRFLRRQIAACEKDGDTRESDAFRVALMFVLEREKRYRPKKGGL